MRRVKFITDAFYHIYNRGTDKRDIFCNNSDYFRFVYSMYDFNDIKRRRCRGETSANGDGDGRGFASTTDDPVDRLVNVCYFVLMPNHFHLVLQQRTKNGIEKFMQKLGTGYTMYFNKKYNRSGVLFQGIFKAIAIETDSYVMQVSRYIHLNPLELIQPAFKEKGIKDLEQAKRFLGNYKWSSYLDCIGIDNFSFLANNKLHDAYFKDVVEYENFVLSGLDAEVSPRTSLLNFE